MVRSKENGRQYRNVSEETRDARYSIQEEEREVDIARSSGVGTGEGGAVRTVDGRVGRMASADDSTESAALSMIAVEELDLGSRRVGWSWPFSGDSRGRGWRRCLCLLALGKCPDPCA